MKRTFVMAAALVLTLSTGISADAYNNFCDGLTVSSVGDEYPAQLKNIGTQFDICLEKLQKGTSDSVENTSGGESTSEVTSEESSDSAQLLKDLYTQRIEIFDEYTLELTTAEYDTAEKLIDYDLLLKKLELLYDEYKVLKEQSQKSSELFKTGGCDKSTVDSDKKAVESKYFDIQAHLAEIYALKTEIEAVTGTTLTSDLNYEQAYLITDVIRLNPNSLTRITGGASLCIPQGVELKQPEVSDITPQYNAALKCYYALGAAMREYVAAEDNIRKCEFSLKMGEATAEQLKAATDEKTTKYMDACTAKAELAKSLIELDRASNGSLTYLNSISYARAAAYISAVSDAKSGSGLWLVGRTPNGIIFMPTLLPMNVVPDKDDIVTYKLEYNGEKIAVAGGFCFIQPQNYKENCNYAKITYYINGKMVGVYKVDVFSPYGEFIS